MLKIYFVGLFLCRFRLCLCCNWLNPFCVFVLNSWTELRLVLFLRYGDVFVQCKDGKGKAISVFVDYANVIQLTAGYRRDLKFGPFEDLFWSTVCVY